MWLLFNREWLLPAQERCWTKSQGLPEKGAGGRTNRRKQTAHVPLSHKQTLYYCSVLEIPATQQTGAGHRGRLSCAFPRTTIDRATRQRSQCMQSLSAAFCKSRESCSENREDPLPCAAYGQTTILSGCSDLSQTQASACSSLPSSHLRISDVPLPQILSVTPPHPPKGKGSP